MTGAHVPSLVKELDNRSREVLYHSVLVFTGQLGCAPEVEIYTS